MSSSSPLTGVAHNELAQQLLQAMPEAILLVDAESLAIFATNAHAERLTGRRSAELVDQHISAIVETSDGTDVSTIWQDSQEPGSDQPSGLIQFLNDDGHRSATMAATCRQFETDGRLAVLLVISDDTELIRLRAIENENQDNAAKLEQVFHALEGFAWEFDPATNAFTYVSPRAKEIFGYETSAWIGNPDFFPSIIHPEDRESVLSFCAFETAAGSDHTMTYRMLAADGAFRWVRDIVYLGRDEAGAVSHLRGLMIDITDEHDLRDALTQSEAQYRRLYNESPIAQFNLDWSGIRNRLQEVRDSGISNLRAWLDEFPEEVRNLSQQARITAVNRGALEMFEVSSIDEFAGSLSAIFKQDSLQVFKEHLLFRIAGGQAFEAENVAYTLSGKRLFVHIRANADPDSEQSWQRIYASVSNITQRRHAEILRDGQRHVLESLAAVNSVETVLNELTDNLEQQSPNIRVAVFRASSADNEFHRIANGATAEELITLIDSVRIDDLYGHSDQYTEIRLTGQGSSSQGDPAERILPSVKELISRAATTCGYRSGVIKPATGAAGQLIGILAVFKTTAAEFTEHEEEAISGFSDLTGLVL
jgi:PAS domain S-box-containing protein